MYGIGNRPAFSNYQYGAKGTKNNAGTFGTDQPKRYYSSSDAEIYFSDYYVDDIVHIQYSVSQNSMPLYGYNSYTYDEVAVGNRIIQGSFSINFTSPGYLFTLLDTIKQDVSSHSNNHQVNKSREGTSEETGTRTASSRLRPGQKPIWNTFFDIDMMFGEENSVGKSKHAVLEGVVIMSSSLQLDVGGNPIAENYSFIARDIRFID